MQDVIAHKQWKADALLAHLHYLARTVSPATVSVSQQGHYHTGIIGKIAAFFLFALCAI